MAVHVKNIVVTNEQSLIRISLYFILTLPFVSKSIKIDFKHSHVQSYNIIPFIVGYHKIPYQRTLPRSN